MEVDFSIIAEIDESRWEGLWVRYIYNLGVHGKDCISQGCHAREGYGAKPHHDRSERPLSPPYVHCPSPSDVDRILLETLL
jgi:hypothetical protein